MKHVKIDMTPMVDLGFLLITFFIFTTTIGEAKALKIAMPADGIASHIGKSSVVTAMLRGGNQIAVYAGDFETARMKNQILLTSFPGLRTLILEKRKEMHAAGIDPVQLMVLIKPTEEATYANIIDALVEIEITQVKTFAVVDPGNDEKDFAGKYNL